MNCRFRVVVRGIWEMLVFIFEGVGADNHTRTEGTMRDMTKAAYEKKMREYGFGPVQFWGYRALPVPFDSRHVSELNGGDTYRGRLRYLLSELRKRQAEEEASK